MRKTTKLLSILLAVLMLASVLPLSVFADDNLSIDVYFVDANTGLMVADAEHVADIEPGSGLDYDVIVTVPEVENYSYFAFVPGTGFEGSITIDEDHTEVRIHVTSISANVSVQVKYTPNKASYTVFHYQQNANNDFYTLYETQTYKNVDVGTVPAGVGPKSYPGFVVQDVAESTYPLTNGTGTAVMSFYYDRLNYKLEFKLNGGYGVSPIYDRYGKSISVGIPVRPGYVFQGWTQNGQPAEVPTIMPRANDAFDANWALGTANYTVAYWIQDPDNTDQYTFYKAETRSAETGSTVNGGPAASTSSIDTALASHIYYKSADQNVTVKADGTTVVNVYYDRKVYTIRFKIGQYEVIHHPAGYVHHDAEVIHHEAEYITIPASGTPAEFSATINGLGNACINGGGVANKTNVLVSHDGHGNWTPLFSNPTPDMTWSGLFSTANMVFVGNYQNCLNHKGERTNSWDHVVPLYAGTTVTIDPSAIKFVNGVPQIDDTKCKTMKNGGTGDMLKAVPVSVVFEGTTYSGYVTKAYITNITGIGGEGYVPEHQELVHEAWDEVISEAYDEWREAWDEYVGGKYYPRRTTTLSDITTGDTIPSITINGSTYYNDYVINVRMGQDISDIWPQRSTIQKEVNGLFFKCTYSPHNAINETLTDQYQLNEPLMNQGTIGNTGYETVYYVTYSNSSYPITLRYRDVSRTENDSDGELIDEQEPLFDEFNYTLNPRDFEGFRCLRNGGYTDHHGVVWDQHGDSYELKSGEYGENYTFFYTRMDYELSYVNEGEALVQRWVYYLDPLAEYDIIPANPASKPAAAFEFGGWYADPGLTIPFDFTSTMPAHGVTLYAKWNPKTLTLTYKNMESDTDPLEAPQTGIEYEGYGHASSTDPSNPGFIFIDWFYRDANGEERPFNPEYVALYQDIVAYAKWRSENPIGYTIHYVLAEDHSTKVAEDTVGSSKYNITVFAKGADELYEEYQNLYFPNVSRITLDLMRQYPVTEYWFEYSLSGPVPYTVKYLNAADNEPVAAEKTVADNKYAIVDEYPVAVEGFVPDASKKRIYISVEEGAENVLIFYYTAVVNEALVTVEHLTSDDNGVTYTQRSYKEEQKPYGDITEGSLEALTAVKYVLTKITVNGEEVTPLTDPVICMLDVNGLDIKFYYIKEEEPMFTVVHSSDGSSEKFKVADYLGGFDITKCIPTSALLYGGLYTDETFETVYTAETWEADYTDNGELTSEFNGLALTPKKDDVFYLKEVPEIYFQPFVLSFYNGSGDSSIVRYSYFMTVLDSLNYSTAGFRLYDESEWVDALSAGTMVVNDETVYEEIGVSTSSSSATISTQTLGYTHEEGYSGKDYIAIQKINGDLLENWKEDESDYSEVTPMVVTTDNVLVRSRYYFYISYPEVGYPTVESRHQTNTNKYDPYDDNSTEVEDTVSAPARGGLLRAMSFRAIGPGAEPEETRVDVTKIVEGQTLVQSVRAGDQTGKISYPKIDGKIFAGWFADSELTVPADFSDVSAEMTVYAKYVSDDYGWVKFNVTKTRGVCTALNPYFAVDSKDFNSVGFITEINGKKTEITVSAYSASIGGKTAKTLFGGEVIAKAKLVTAAVSGSGLADGTIIRVTPFWTTMDGTVVYAETRAVSFSAAAVTIIAQ